MIELAPNLPQFRRSGRWTQTDSGSLTASWASASISFVLTSSSNLSIRLGPRTSHKYTFVRNSTTLVCTVSDATGSHDHHDQHHISIPTSPQVLSFPDVKPGLLSLFDRLEVEDGHQKLIEIALVDWSSVVEVVSIVIDSLEAVQAPPDPSSDSRLLFIGGSIACGFSTPPMLIPHGSLDAFTSRAAAQLGLPYDIVAYPGITLVDPNAADVFIVRNPGMVSRFFLASSSGSDDTPARLDERPTIIVTALGTNDRGIGVEPAFFVQTMCAFVTRLVDVYHETLAHVCILHPFPYFGLQPPSGYSDAFTQIADQVSADHPSIGVHVWDLGDTLNRSLTIDRLHPTVQGHVALGKALAEILRPLIADIHDVTVSLDG